MLTSLSHAHNAYAVQSLQSRLEGVTDDIADGIQNSSATGSSSSGTDFGSILSQSVSSVIDSGHDAEAKAAQGLKGGGDMTQIVTAISNAQLALQTTTVIRDRMVQAYQDVMKMTI
ncbi:flagellar hook-basal body protein FliE [Gluconobacter albidus]|uniref:Flagellar hook-basal body complex protein FliE n=1 Tax=Gluconobacter albidus TaxID=318683 RepID=A0A149T0K2_9PROT|nr:MULTISPECIES: flagellar hook-basal body complex protein FliE [Gluconobacter]AQS89895.1 flagellar hook-basal body protein FliE [Gluconobacter albidus]KXV37774.1 flagellar hook-basal body protein FliE [Gluconobacter albidus]KXV47127.1 flagellar hook-basal body protein FliE [Gluconobacter albidus]OUI82409.1 flagellar hook-basal body protein FliE [Gluconobacter sp. DsW_056]GBQ92853.1 flagellar hook-basal body protein FleE [Gluconobacter albidus NBRC 3250]